MSLIPDLFNKQRIRNESVEWLTLLFYSKLRTVHQPPLVVTINRWSQWTGGDSGQTCGHSGQVVTVDRPVVTVDRW